MPIYRPSEIAQLITVRRPIATTITLEVRGSEDGYATPRTEFTTEETIMVDGDVIAADGANLTAGVVEVYVNGAFKGNASLNYDPATMSNFYTFTIGMLTVEAQYEITVRFPRLRI